MPRLSPSLLLAAPWVLVLVLAACPTTSSHAAPLKTRAPAAARARLALVACSTTSSHAAPVKTRRPAAARTRVVAYQSKDDDGGTTDEPKISPSIVDPKTNTVVVTVAGPKPCMQLIGDDDHGYGLPGTLVRQGPTALIARILAPVDYELGVQKFMALRSVSRKAAQVVSGTCWSPPPPVTTTNLCSPPSSPLTGCPLFPNELNQQANIDASLADPNSWLFHELHHRSALANNSTYTRPDYANTGVDMHQLALSTVWAVVIVLVSLKIALVGWPAYTVAHLTLTLTLTLP
jgi:hypothetical protein